jgi:transcriptional regulator with XRE-family HTH domain
MKIKDGNTDDVVLTELGDRVARTRLERNMDQRKLAIEAGVSKITVERLEAGETVKMTSFIRVLRALGLLGRLDQLVPEPLPSPLERLKTSGRQRRRATGRRGGAAQPQKDEPAGGWTWADTGENGETG